MSKSIVYDGELFPADKRMIPVSSRGLMYGDGAFETFRIYQSRSFLFQQHLQRLKEALHFLSIAVPTALHGNILKKLIFELLKENQLLESDAIVRVQVWRSGERGYSPENKGTSHFSVTASKCPHSFEFPSLVTVSRKRIPSVSLPSQYKLSNSLNLILAAKEAEQMGGDDALMRTIEGYVSETTLANIFWVKKDRVYTPSADCDLLPGITRQAVIELINNSSHLSLEEGAYKSRHLIEADGIWITNSVREILPVAKVDGHGYNTNNPQFSRIQQDFIHFRNSHLKPLVM